MGLGGMIGNLLQQYATSQSAPAAADQHFDQVAQAVDHSSLSSALGSMMQSAETPEFGEIVGQLFQNGNADQKASMLNAILANAGPQVLSQLSGLLPGVTSGATVTPAQAQAIPPEAVTQIAAHAEKHDPSIIDRMSNVYASHPTLVKALGTGAMIVALREVAKKFAPQS